jgi:hypothetical protein
MKIYGTGDVFTKISTVNRDRDIDNTLLAVGTSSTP